VGSGTGIQISSSIILLRGGCSLSSTSSLIRDLGSAGQWEREGTELGQKQGRLSEVNNASGTQWSSLFSLVRAL
jgi:hypothetical protein